MKNNKGITLIALVVTIIILLVLAGVTLSLISGQDGILGKSVKAVNENNQVASTELSELKRAQLKVKYYEEKYVNYSTDKNFEEYSQEYNSQHPELHIPTGFSHKEGTVNEGYVIVDSKGNEFVWVPVPNKEAYAKKIGSHNWYVNPNYTSNSIGVTLEEAVKGDVLGVSSILGETIPERPENIVDLVDNQPEAKIVNNAGGFWVGRYETGIVSVEHENIAEITNSGANATDAETLNEYWEGQKKNIVVKQNCEPVRFITQSKALEIANNWKSGTFGNGTVAFQSGLITGSQWDAMCKFVGLDVSDSDCETWGNYMNSKSAEFTGFHSSDESADWINETTEVKKGNENKWVFPTGKFSSENGVNTAKKNIFDIAGNVFEFTTEVSKLNNDYNRVARGGSTGNVSGNAFATLRNGNYDGNAYYYNTGFRIVLYVE